MKRRYTLIVLLAIVVAAGTAWIQSLESPGSKALLRPGHSAGQNHGLAGTCSHSGCSKGGMHPANLEALDRRTRQRLFTEPPPGPDRVRLVKATKAESDWKGQTGGALRAREIEIAPEFLSGEPLPKGEALTLNLFDDVSVDTIVYESFVNVNGTVSTISRVAGTMHGRAVLAFTHNELRAKIILPESDRIYAVHYNHTDGKHYSLELDPAVVDVDACETTHDSPYANLPETAPSPSAGSGEATGPPMVEGDEGVALVVIDAMVVYPDNVVTSAGSEANVKNIAAQGIALANDSHIATDTGMYINLVHSARLTGYTDSGSMSTDLDRVTYSRSAHYYYDPWNKDPGGEIDQVHEWRDAYGADFVHMMHSAGGGLAFRPNFSSTSSGDPQFAFSVTGWSRFDSYTPAHEMGHNMNLSHAKFQSSYPGSPTNPTGTDAAGWHWHPGGDPAVNGYCSVMSYTSYSGEAGHTRVGLFSDPYIVHNGQPAGDVNHGNCARVLRLYKNIYAAYRSRPLASNSILVENPNGGETYVTGESVEFRWNSNGVSGDIKIELYNDGEFEREVAASTLNDRIFYYTIPSDLPSSSRYTLRVSSVNNPLIEDYSDVQFTIKEVIYASKLDSDPGFTTSGGWEYGAPYGDNYRFGGADAAFTGTNIYDTDLGGVSTVTGYLTTPAIDCSAHQNVTLEFAGWFSVYSGYQANVEVSNNGSTWTQVSSVVGTKRVSEWSEYSYDISSVAAGQSTVYVRWVHLNNGGAGNYSGMSVDDVSLSGIAINSPYDFWSGASPPGADDNGDGVSNGVAWALGATGPNVDASPLMPTVGHTTDPAYMVFTYRRSDTANADPNTMISVEYGSSLSAWIHAIHDNDDVIITETNDYHGPGIDRVQVQLKKALASSNKLFARLKVVVNN